MTTSHGMLVAHDMYKSKGIQDQAQSHFLCKAIPESVPLLLNALPTPDYDISLWISQYFSDGCCLILSYTLISCLYLLPKLDFLKGTDPALSK